MPPGTSGESPRDHPGAALDALRAASPSCHHPGDPPPALFDGDGHDWRDPHVRCTIGDIGVIASIPLARIPSPL
jgi:hypothetical protein